jgi:hypothetical protein
MSAAIGNRADILPANERSDPTDSQNIAGVRGQGYSSEWRVDFGKVKQQVLWRKKRKSGREGENSHLSLGITDGSLEVGATGRRRRPINTTRRVRCKFGAFQFAERGSQSYLSHEQISAPATKKGR